ncbi:rhodanese-like domain-containing protein 4A, chloroplastic [Curcuma longa]|uniref:rhodanese-like domain-containing protein 4A, chloroplastic n=1 Tax=Curcuma longa TaxID=136217 RepID=UPI003D9F3C48
MASLPDHRFIPKPSAPLHFPPRPLAIALPLHISISNFKSFARIPPPSSPNRLSMQLSALKIRPFFAVRASTRKTSPPFRSPPASRSSNKLTSFLDLQVASSTLALISSISFAFPTLAAEADQVSQKINIEQILVSIDDFFNRNPFFVSGVTVIWLVVIPLTQQYLKKYKFISAIDAFRKLRDLPNAQLLDVRKTRSVKYMASPNLKILNKSAVWVEYSEGNEEGLVKEVLQNFADPQNTVICVLDNFDGDSLKLAELLYKNGFKEAYAIRGGLRGKNGWQEIQETFLPPSVHVHPKKKRKESRTQTEVNGSIQASIRDNQEGLNTNNAAVNATEIVSATKIDRPKPLSPYSNYPELKPPSSPSPTKPPS